MARDQRGVAWLGINAAAQAPQIALATASSPPVPPELAAMVNGLGAALFTISNVPLAVMLAAVALVARQTGTFPDWLTWLSAACAVATAAMPVGIVAESGPLVPGAGPPTCRTRCWLAGSSA